jgi:energy-coupling factor transporter ATP-binding protein EcfA2
MFDLEKKPSREEWHFDLELPEEWQIGLIVGPSGSGKTTIGNKLFSNSFKQFEWPHDQTVIDGFSKDLSVRQIASALSSVGFSSPPAWLRSFHVLSMGQQFRANIARALLEGEEIIAVDEFTSVVDRTVAQIGSAAISKAIRRGSKRFVAVACHYDIIDWLQPDWILHMPEGRLERRSLRRFPTIEIEVEPGSTAQWETFRRHHYLDHNIARSAKCFVATWQGRPVAFASVMSFPHPTRPGYREHRTVCLPDFQGVGIGNKLSELVASAYRARGKPYRSCTSHPAMMRYRAKSKLWKMTRKPSRVKPIGPSSSMKVLKRTNSRTRFTASFEFVGPTNHKVAKLWGLI